METKQSKDRESTSSLLGGIFKASELDAFIGSHQAAFEMPTLPAYLCALCEQKGVERFEAVRRAGIDRSYGFQIFQGTKNPSRDKVIQLAVGLMLDYEEAQALIKIAQKPALYPRFKRDAAIIYCINKHLSYTDTQAVLSGLDLTILGKERD